LTHRTLTRQDLPVPESLTVDELAARIGLPSSTIRMYQTKGVLHAPRRQGRVAYYDASHVERLTLVQRLQQRGFSLPAIAELISAREKGESVAAVLGMGETEGPDDWVRIKVRDIRHLVPMGDVQPRLLLRAMRLGLVRWKYGWPHARRWALEAGGRLAGLRVPSDDVMDSFTRLRTATDAVAADFVRLFERQFWPELARKAGDENQLENVRALLVELTYTAETAVVGTLRESIRDAAEEFASRHGLLPSDDYQPAWAEQPLPPIAENIVDPAGDLPSEQEIENFLKRGDEDEPGR